MPLLEVRQLSIAYGDPPAVRDPSLDVDEGQLVSVIGPLPGAGSRHGRGRRPAAPAGGEHHRAVAGVRGNLWGEMGRAAQGDSSEAFARVTVLAGSSGHGSEIELKAIRNAGRALGVKILMFRANPLGYI